MSDNSLLVTLTIGDLKQLIKEAIAELNNQDQQPQSDEFLSIAAAVKLFNPAISKVTLHRWKKEGVIPAYRMGGRIYYKRSEVMAAAQNVRKYDRNRLLPTA